MGKNKKDRTRKKQKTKKNKKEKKTTKTKRTQEKKTPKGTLAIWGNISNFSCFPG